MTVTFEVITTVLGVPYDSVIREMSTSYYNTLQSSYGVGWISVVFDETACSAPANSNAFSVYAEDVIDDHTCSFNVEIEGTNTAPFLDPEPVDGVYRVSDVAPNESLPKTLDLTIKDDQINDSFTYTLTVRDSEGNELVDPSFFVTEELMVLSFFTTDNSYAGVYSFEYAITDSNSCRALAG